MARCRTSSIDAPRNTAPDDDAPTSPKRRMLVTYLGASVATALLATLLPGDHHDTGSPASRLMPLSPERKEHVSQSNTNVEISGDPSFEIPSFSISRIGSPSFPKPNGLDMPDREFQALIRRIADKVRLEATVGGNAPLLRDLARPDYPQVSEYFINLIVNYMRELSPQIQTEIDWFLGTPDSQDTHHLIAHINRYLNPAGIYLSYQNATGIPQLELFPITGESSIDVTDNKGTERVVVISVLEDLISTENKVVKEGGEIAFCDPLFNHAIVFQERVNMSAPYIMEVLSVYNLPNFRLAVPLENFIQAYFDRLLCHEATHIFTGRRFPKSGKMREFGKLVRTPLLIKVGGKDFNLSNNYPPVAFQELCGIGAQIASAPDSTVFHTIGMFLSSSERGPGYELVYGVLPFAILKACPEGPTNQKLVKLVCAAGNGGSIENTEFLNLVGSAEFSANNAREVGKILYQLGCQLLDKTERGELKYI